MNSALNYSNTFWPEIVFVEESAKEDPLTKRVLNRLKNAEVINIPDKSPDPLFSGNFPGKKLEKLSASEKFSIGKKALILKRHLGNWLKNCPGTQDHVCCNLWIVNPGEGCPMDCTYCYLQSYLQKNPTLKIYTNTSDLLGVLKERAEKEPNRLFRVGTGELIDSLVWDDLTDLTLELVPFFAKIPNLTLELKSKHDYIENLLNLKNEHNGKTVVSWSVNAQTISQNDEAQTANLEKRITAAKKLVEVGYRVGFHFDPLIYFPGWEDEYKETIDLIFSNIPSKHIAWVSISTLRYQQEMQNIMIERFPKSKLPFGEQFLASDHKLRYIQPIRFKMLNFVWKELKAKSAELPVYMCMESASAWRQINGAPPLAGSELVEIFSRRGKLSIVKDEKNISPVSY